jgi:hypothetical protein
MNIPSGSVNAIENWDHESGVVDFKSTVETDDLKHSRDYEQNNGKYRSQVAELVSWILM